MPGSVITLGEVLTPALEVVIENHGDTADPVVIEGDAILPALISRPIVQTRASHGQIQAVFLVEPEEDALLAHMDARYRRSVQYQATELQAMAHVRWLHGCWLAEEARRYQLPVGQSRPWQTLAQRIVAVLT